VTFNITDIPFWVGFLAMCVIPSIFQEFWFRGALFSEYDGVPIRRRAIVTGLFFGLFLFNFYQAFYGVLLGVLFVYLVYYTRSILASILMGFIYNCIAFLMLFFESFTAYYYALRSDTPMFLLVIGGLSAVALPTIIICLKKLSLQYGQHMPAPLDDVSATAASPKVLNWAFWAVLVFYFVASIFMLYFRWILRMISYG